MSLNLQDHYVSIFFITFLIYFIFDIALGIWRISVHKEKNRLLREQNGLIENKNKLREKIVNRYR